MEIQFEKLQEKHLIEVLEIEKLSFKDPWTREFFRSETLSDISKFFVALAGMKVAVYGGFWKALDEADIVNLAVSPEFRNKGVGRKILEQLLRAAKDEGVKTVYLEVRAENPYAQRLYASCGFRSVGRRKKYYGDEDALIMEKKLGEE
jgi:ribosomal-protein-alanine N-acetyltransferase